MPARNRVPSFQIASGTANQRDNSYNIPTGSIFFNTDTSNIELSGNVVVAGDISATNVVASDISATNVVASDISATNVVAVDASFTRIDAVDASFSGNISAVNIATNTSDISSLITATNPCFKTASINGQNLILTPITGQDTIIPIPSGDAVLNAGTNGTPQDFTGVNKFNKLLIGVNTSSQAFHNTSTTNLVGPIYASGTFQQNLNVNARIKAYSGLFSWAQQYGFTNSSDTSHPTMRLFRASEMMGSTAYSGYSSLMYGGTSSANRIYFRNALNQTPSTNNGNIVLYATSFVSTSDDRLKHNERYITDALKTLCKLRPQRYLKYGEGEDIEEAYEDSGLIAQEIWYDAPELRFIVRIPPDADPQPLDRPYDPQDDPDYEKFGWTEAMSYVDYMALSGYYIQAFKDLDAKNKELEARLEALEKK